MATPYNKEITVEELNKRKKKKRPGQAIADIMASQQMTAGYPGRAGSTATSGKFGEQVKGGPAPIRKSLAPETSVRPKARLPIKKQPFQRLSPREAKELEHSGVEYKGIPEGTVPATVMPSGDAGMSARDRAEMGMKKGRSVKKMKKGRKVRGAGIAQRGVRAAKMR